MDLRYFLIATATIAACGGARDTRTLAPGQRATAPAVGLRHASSLARGQLTYDVAWARNSGQLTSIELGLSFTLVTRDVAGRGARGKATRVRLGDPTYDVTDVAVDAAGATAWVASLDGSVRRVDLRAGKVVARWPIGDSVTSVDVSPDGTRLVLGTIGGIVCLRRIRDAALLQCVAAHGQRVSAVRFSPTGKQLASSAWDGSVILWRVPSLAVVARRDGRGSANDVAFDPSGTRLAIARSHVAPQRTPDVAARERKTVHTRAVGSVVEIWRPGAGARRCSGHAGPVTGVAWTQDGLHALSVSWDRSVRLWRAQDCHEVARVGGYGGPLWRVDVDPSGRYVAVAAWAGGLKHRATSLLYLLYPPAKAGVH